MDNIFSSVMNWSVDLYVELISSGKLGDLEYVSGVTILGDSVHIL